MLTGSKNHGRSIVCLVVNEMVRRDRLQAVGLTGLRRAWSKGLQTLGSNVRHTTWSLDCCCSSLAQSRIVFFLHLASGSGHCAALLPVPLCYWPKRPYNNKIVRSKFSLITCMFAYL